MTATYDTSLFKLSPQAFKILSDAYAKIGELSLESIDVQDSPRQPIVEDQLINVSSLFDIIMRNIVLSDDGTEIIGITGQDVSVVNELLMDLKGAAELNPLSILPAPLNNLNFNIGDTPVFNFGSLSAGDLMYYTGSEWSNLAKGSDGDVLVSTPTGIQWQSVVGNGLPSGGSTHQYLRKNTNTSYDAGWHTLVLGDITDVTASASEVNKLAGSLMSTAELNRLVGVTSPIQTQLDAKLGTSLTNGKFLVGNGSSVATAVTPTGDVTFDNAGVFAIGSGVIVNADVNASAAIARTKLASGNNYRVIVNSSSGVMSEAAAISSNRALISDANGVPTYSTTTATQIGYLSSLISDAQGQIDTKLTVSLSSVAQGDIVYYNGSQWVNLAKGTTGQVLTSGASTIAWGAATANGVPTGGSTGDYLVKASGTDYDTTWYTLVLTLSSLTDVSTTATELNQLSGVTTTSAQYNYLNTLSSNVQTQIDNKLSHVLPQNALFVGDSGNLASVLAAGSDGQVLQITAGVPTWQTVTGTGTVTSIDVSGGSTGLSTSGGPITTNGTITLAGTLNATHGGTSFSTYATGDIIYASASNTLSKLAAGTNGYVLTLAAGVPTWAAPSSAITGSGTSGRMTFWNGSSSVTSDSTLLFNSTDKILTSDRFHSSLSADPSGSVTDGDWIYNSTALDLRGRINGQWTNLTRPEIVVDSTTARTLSEADRNKIIYFTNSSTVTVTGANLAIGTMVTLIKEGTGDVVFTPAGGLTYEAISTTIINQYGAATWVKKSATVWTGFGALGTGGGAGGVWGAITGTLSSQTDLQTALDAKLDLTNTTFTQAGSSTINTTFKLNSDSLSSLQIYGDGNVTTIYITNDLVELNSSVVDLSLSTADANTSAIFTDIRTVPVGIKYAGFSDYSTLEDDSLVTKQWVIDQGYSTGAGSGTVTSVSFTGGIISVATATTTPALTVAGVSGGVVYFSSNSTWASSSLLTANAIMIGGGAATAPSTTTTATGALTFLGTPTSANLRGLLTDENGTGAALFNGATTPNWVTGFTIGGLGTTGKFIVGDGTNYVPSTSTIPTSAGATANKVLLSDGTNYVLSTPTFPNASATSGKTIRSDGTNWIASTATLSDAPSTALKWLRSDGTNWITSTSTLAEGGVTAGKHLKSDGTNWVATTATISDAPSTALKWLRSDGTNWITSTSTLAEGGVTSGKILVSDGTNWVASTPTFPNASATSGKFIISDGTNFVASTTVVPNSATTGDIPYASAANTYSNLAAVATGSVLGSAGTSTAPAYLAVSNGLTATSSTFKWGGAVTAATSITGAFAIDFTNNAPGHKLDGTYTATANNQTHWNFTGTLTSRATASDNFTAYTVAPSLTAGSTSQNLVALRINPTWSTTNSPNNVGLWITVGTGDTGALPLYIETTAGARLFQFSAGGALSMGSNGTANFSSQNNGSIGATGRGPSLAGTINSSNNTCILFTHNSGGTLTDGTTANKKFIDFAFNWAASSGTVGPTFLNYNGTMNATGTFSGTWRFLDYNPTYTSTTGVTEYFITNRSTSAFTGLGTASPGYMLEIKGAANANLFCIKEDGGNKLFEVLEASATSKIGFFNVTAVAQQTSGANLTNSVTSGGTDDTIANFTDLTTYSNDAATIRNDIYQLARKLKQINDGLRSFGLFT